MLFFLQSTTSEEVLFKCHSGQIHSLSQALDERLSLLCILPRSHAQIKHVANSCHWLRDNSANSSQLGLLLSITSHPIQELSKLFLLSEYFLYLAHRKILIRTLVIL
jgi:hypothetical protein